MKAMILAAGRGRRMGVLTEKCPKPLTVVKNKTLIEYILDKLKGAGVDEVVINLHWLGEQIENLLKDGSNWNLKINYSYEKEMLGTGGGILNALPFLGKEPFWLINADVFSDFKISNKFVLSPSMLGHLILTPNPTHHPNGDFDLNNGLVECSIQKKASYTYSGMSVISPNLFRDMKDKIFPLEPILLEKASQGKLSGELHRGMWTDVGTKERLLNLEKFLSSN